MSSVYSVPHAEWVGVGKFICSINICIDILYMHVKVLAYITYMPNNYINIITLMQNNAVMLVLKLYKHDVTAIT